MKDIRSDFPIFEKRDLIYLDSAATTHKPRSVIDAMQSFYSEGYGTVHRAIYSLALEATARYCAVREQIRAFLNAKFSEEIVFTKGTTEAINLVASSFGKAFVNAGDEILISETEHHANIVPWQMVCQERGATLKSIPVDDSGELILSEYEKLLTERTRLVSIAHIANATGTHHPIEEIIALAHKKGAKVFVDGAQSASHIPIDIQKLDADFFAFSGHKAFGPTGVGILYGKRELLEKMPPYQTGGDMIQKVVLGSQTTFQDPPLRFEAGTPMIAEVIGLGEAIKYIESLGRDQIAKWEESLLRDATEKLLQVPEVRLIGTAKKKGPIISFMVKDLHPLDIGTLLNLRGVALRTGHLCAQPTMYRFGIPAALRISFAAYNSFEDIDRFIFHLKDVIKTLQ
jgi:cysteine desulfurase / selenocysteine lyase